MTSIPSVRRRRISQSVPRTIDVITDPMAELLTAHPPDLGTVTVDEHGALHPRAGRHDVVSDVHPMQHLEGAATHIDLVPTDDQ